MSQVLSEPGNMVSAGADQQQKTENQAKTPSLLSRKESSNDDLKRVAPKRPKRRKIFVLFTEFPLDVLYEIFSHLAPLDLLHLTRCTKDLRRVLLTKNALAVWRTAYSSVKGISPCPEDVSLPKWCSLCFETFCQRCFAKNVRRILFHLRVRYCAKCIKATTTAHSSFDPGVKRDQIILACVPFQEVHKGLERFCLRTDVDEFLARLGTVSGDRTEWVRAEKAKLFARIKVSLPFINWHEDERDRHWTDNDEIRKKRSDDICSKLTELGFKEELDWLMTLEYGGSFPLWHDHPRVKEIKPLTDRTWANMKEGMVEYMLKVRTKMQQELRQARLLDRKLKLGLAYQELKWKETIHSPARPIPVERLTALWPTLLDVYERPDIKRIFDFPPDQPVTTTTFQAALARLENELPAWRQGQIETLAMQLGRQSMYSHSLPYIEGFCTPAFLELAICVVTCANSDPFNHRWHSRDGKISQCMWFPHFLHETCTVECSHWHPHQASMTEEEFTAIRENDMDKTLLLDRQPHLTRFTRFNWDNLYFNDKAATITKTLLDLCSYDCRTTTVSQMDQSKARFVCLKCSYGYRCDGRRFMKIMDWRRAVHHTMNVHFGSAAIEWQKISYLDTDQVLQLEAEEADRLRQADDPDLHPSKPGFGPNEEIYRCVHCAGLKPDPGPKTLSAISKHLRKLHGVEDDPQLNVDYFRAVDVPPSEPLPVKMKPRKVD